MLVELEEKVPCNATLDDVMDFRDKQILEIMKFIDTLKAPL